MALVTYLVRMLPLAAIRRKITSPFVLSFLYYVPYAVLTAMIVALSACGGVLAAELVMQFLIK